mmetsp:Transcript_19963/g.30223  ORF Transcript_19963/g.30223 Transcript_19963/m.30223 type:complete len:135 (-) Transcript_19963:417-821(-)
MSNESFYLHGLKMTGFAFTRNFYMQITIITSVKNLPCALILNRNRELEVSAASSVDKPSPTNEEGISCDGLSINSVVADGWLLLEREAVGLNSLAELFCWSMNEGEECFNNWEGYKVGDFDRRGSCGELLDSVD